MKRDVIVKIKAAILSGPDKEEIFSQSKGCYYDKNDYFYVLYDEETEDGNVNKCRLKISSDEMEMKKTGEYVSCMVFSRNEVTASQYRTPFGVFDLTINTKRLDIFSSAEDTKIKLEYDMSMGNDNYSRHMIDIIIKEQ